MEMVQSHWILSEMLWVGKQKLSKTYLISFNKLNSYSDIDMGTLALWKAKGHILKLTEELTKSL